MADNARGVHVSAGVYSREIELSYAVKSLGITTLGVAGETLKGPAFEPISIENWNQFKDVFGGTSTEKFKGTQYPKYELPYIAKSYLSQSKQLEVCRVLGLSGYNAGPAWAITAKRGDEHMVVAVIRSRGYYLPYEKYEANEDNCRCGLGAYDKLHYYVGEFEQKPACDYATHYNAEALSIKPYYDINGTGDECSTYAISGSASSYEVSTTNYGCFSLSGFTGTPSNAVPFSYSVTLNPGDKNYILKVLGTNPSDGEAPIYVESLYDVAHIQGIEAKEITEIDGELTFYDVCYQADLATIPAVNDFVTKEENALSRKDVGKRFLCADNFDGTIKSTYHTFETNGNNTKLADDQVSGDTSVPTSGTEMVNGQVYTVRTYVDKSGKRHYLYAVVESGDTIGDSIKELEDEMWSLSGQVEIKNCDIYPNVDSYNRVFNKSVLVKNNADGFYYRKDGDDVARVTCDLNNYKSTYRYASTPWIVSNVKGDAQNIDVNKLFRFHTISDGNGANNEVKISISNIQPKNGSFNVLVRAINDTDSSPIVLESYANVTLVPGDKNYIAYRIGSFDGVYESKSKYITVEVNETTATKNSVPAGFLGYPLSQFGGKAAVNEAIIVSGAPITDDYKVVAPYIKYNCDYDIDTKNRKQYFGLSDRVGVDIDMFTYKGKAAYTDMPESLSDGFHLDCRMSKDSYSSDASGNTDVVITVDGVEGYKFETVSVAAVTNRLENPPMIGTEELMDGSIFEMVDLRKFTVYFYGGFDGWDEYRTSRSNTDDFKYSKYNGEYRESTGEGFAFDRIDDAEGLGLNQNGITSDWYAYLAAIRKFANPEEVDINVFATPGIDYVNNKLLVEETIEMVEQERADSIYVVTTPDKPSGAYDFVDEMYTAEDAVDNLIGTDIDSNYTCTYFPWVKYEDTDNNQYIYLPATKDVVRNMALTDNVAHPWFAPAGLDRGDVDCVRAHKITKLADEDALYEGRINPVKTFANEGVKIWGQKNLQIHESQLNRIAVRRLLLRMRKLIAIACLHLIFEPNDATVKDKFLSIVTPILDNIRANRGMSDYKIEVDDTLEARERRELPAKIFFKPYNALEYVVLDFILTPEGLSFSDI